MCSWVSEGMNFAEGSRPGARADQERFLPRWSASDVGHVGDQRRTVEGRRHRFFRARES